MSFGRVLCCLSISFACFATSTVRADEFQPSNAWGQAGLRHVDAARALSKNSVALSFGAELADFGDFVLPQGHDLWSTERLYAVWAPYDGLEVGFSGGFLTNNYQSFVRHRIQVLGAPQVRLKYTWIAQGLSAIVTTQAPNSPQSGQLVVPAGWVQGSIAGTWQPASFLNISANLGYRFDNSGQLMADPEPDERFALNLTASQHHALLGLGAHTDFKVGNAIDLAPFLEFFADIGSGLTLGQDPVLASAGLKARFTTPKFLELGIGADARLNGAPTAGGRYPGEAPWTAFAMLNIHLFDAPTVTVCDNGNDCPAEQVCVNHRCAVVVKIEVERQVLVHEPTFLVEGSVRCDDGNTVPADAWVKISAFKTLSIATNPRTGAFQSFPIPVTKGVMKITAGAPGYHENEVVLPTGQDGQVVPVQLRLSKDTHIPYGTLRGNLKNAHTGKPIEHGRIDLLDHHLKIFSDENGAFESVVQAGRQHIVVSAPGFESQDHSIIIKESDVAIMNIDLASKHNPALRRSRPRGQ